MLCVTQPTQTHRKQLCDGGSLLPLLHQTLLHKVHEVRRVRRGGERRRGIQANRLHRRLCSQNAEGVPSLCQLDEGDAQRPDVGFQASRSVEHLGSHVTECATDCGSMGRGGVQLRCQAEIAQFYCPIVTEEEIVGLDVLSLIEVTNELHDG